MDKAHNDASGEAVAASSRIHDLDCVRPQLEGFVGFPRHIDSVSAHRQENVPRTEVLVKLSDLLRVSAARHLGRLFNRGNEVVDVRKRRLDERESFRRRLNKIKGRGALELLGATEQGDTRLTVETLERARASGMHNRASSAASSLSGGTVNVATVPRT